MKVKSGKREYCENTNQRKSGEDEINLRQDLPLKLKRNHS